MKKNIRLILFVLIVMAYMITGTVVNAHAQTGSSEVVIDIDTLEVLHSSNMDARLEMASTTKIMTALIALENSVINDYVTIDSDSINVEGSSLYLKAGEELTYIDIVYGLMLRSGNDCANVLANNVFGDYQKFINKMNEKVTELGLNNTSFKNPHGLHAEGHYTSSYDLAVITATAMHNHIFKKISLTSKIQIGERLLVNKHQLLTSYEGCTGGKTGYTKASGRCLVTTASRNGRNLVCVVLNCYDMWNRTTQLLDNCF